MKCPKCVEDKTPSKVYPGGSWSTSMGYQSYYDEEGEPHSHDSNTRTTSYRCSNGHEWYESSSGSCVNCDWTSKPYDPTGMSGKVDA